MFPGQNLQNLPGRAHPPIPRCWCVTHRGRCRPPPPLLKDCASARPHAPPSGGSLDQPLEQRLYPSVCSQILPISRPKQGLVQGSTGLQGHTCPPPGGQPWARSPRTLHPSPVPGLGRTPSCCHQPLSGTTRPALPASTAGKPAPFPPRCPTGLRFPRQRYTMGEA